MDLELMRKSPIGRLVPISGVDDRTSEEYAAEAYVPSPLPRDPVNLTPDAWSAVSAAEAALARLDQASRQMPDPWLLARPSLRREAQSTSALEGTFAPLDDVLGSSLDERENLSVELREVLNYVDAAEQGFEWIRDRPITIGLLSQLQGVLVKDTSGEMDDSGGVRDRQVFIGARDRPISEARYVPPPPGDRLRVGFEDWVTWVEGDLAPLPSVLLTGMAHYQFESLHPYSDGNGRIGRLVIVLQLMRLGTISQPMLVVSPWFEERRSEYQDRLLDLSQTGEWSNWICFFSRGIEGSANSTLARIQRLLDWREAALERARGAGLRGVAERLAGDLIGFPIVRAAEVARHYEVSQQAAIRSLRKVGELGLVTELARGRNVLFWAEDVMRILRI